MKIVSANIDGVSTAVSRGFFDWLGEQAADVVCLQELNSRTAPRTLQGWASHQGYDLAVSPNPEHTHGGTAILSRLGFGDIRQASGLLAGRGQYVEVSVGELRVASVYVSLNNSEDERDAFQEHFDRLSTFDLALIAGDFNIIATPSDAAVKYGATAIGCKPLEREWIARLKSQWIDALSQVCTVRPLYTWWSNNARFEQNLGTRLDYQFATPGLASKVRSGSIFRQQFKGRRISDHAPLVLEYAVEATKLGVSTNNIPAQPQRVGEEALARMAARKEARAATRQEVAAARPIVPVSQGSGTTGVALERLEESEVNAGVTFAGLFLQDDDFGSDRFLAIKGLIKPTDGTTLKQSINITAILYDHQRRVLDVATEYVSAASVRAFRPFNLTLQVPKGEQPSALCIYPAIT